MTGQILKLHPWQLKGSGVQWRQVDIKTEDGAARYTYVSTGFRNYRRWRGVLREGQWLTGLDLMRSGLVDADSKLEPCAAPPKPDGGQGSLDLV